MTTAQAKKDARIKLDASGIPYQELRAKSVSFQGFGYGTAIFVYVYGIDFQAPLLLERWDQLCETIPKPSQGGYILKSAY